MSRQRGVALITVLLVVAIVTVVCAGLITRQQLAIKSTTNQMQARQAWHYALGGEGLAQSILRRDLEDDIGAKEQEPVDHLQEAWALPRSAFAIEHGEIRLHIEDLAGRFNLNSLIRDGQPNGPALAQFRRLLLRLQINAPYADRLLDWLDDNTLPNGEFGAEDNAYLLLDPPYRTANRRLEDLSELRLLLGISDEEFQRLAPYLNALPEDVPLNVNTASAMVLSSLDNSLTLVAADALVEARKSGGFRDIGAFLAQPAMINAKVQGISLSVSSHFFQVTSEVSLAGRRFTLVSSLQRQRDGKVRVLSRDLGQASRLRSQLDNGG